MTGLSHIVTGGLVGALIPQPWVALPLAVVSHFVLDMLPHYGDNPIDHLKASRHIRRLVLLDTGVCILFFSALLIFRPEHWAIIAVAGAAAQLPDLMWLPNYIRARQNLPQKPYNIALRLHKRIQWSEHPTFFHATMETLWLITTSVMLLAVIQ